MAAKDKEKKDKGAGIVLGLGAGFGLLVAFLMRRKGLPPVPKATISGTVTDSITNNPIAGATVMAGSSTTTDSDGHYLITGIPVGDTLVIASHPDYESMSQTVNLPEGETIFDFSLVPKAVIVGIVGDQDTGSPVAGAKVMLDGLSVTTDADGIYTMTRLDPGQYTLRITHAEYLPHEQPVTLLPGLNQVDVLLEARASLSGIIRDVITNNPVAGVLVTFGAFETASGTDGRYSLAELPVGPGTVMFEHPFYEMAEFDIALVKGMNILDVLLAPTNFVFDGRRHTPEVYSMVPETLFPADYLNSVGLRALSRYASIKVGDDVYCFGGNSAIEGNSRSNQAWKYNLTSRSWTRLPNVPNVNWAGCAYNTVGYRNGRIWVFFSEAQYMVNAGVAVFDVASETWVASYSPIPGIPSYPLALPADYGYYALSGSLYRLDYATGGWSPALAVQPSTTRIGGIISGLLYILGDDRVVSRWDETNDVWRNMLQDFPAPVQPTKFVDETNSALYCMTAETNKELLQYTPPSGWEYLCQMYAVNPSRILLAANGEHVLTFDYPLSASEVKQPSLYRFIPDGVDFLGVKMLDAGDVLNVEIPAGATLYIEKDSRPWMEVTENVSIQIVQTTNYRFTMESRFQHEDVRISWEHP